MIRVIHITAHMSGGLAAVLLSTLKYAGRFTPEIDHEILTLDDLSPETEELFKDYRQRLYVRKPYEFIRSKVNAADIVQIEYWNHPLIYKFLHLFEFPPSRLLTCCHISGLYRPQVITKNIVEFSDIFLAVTRATEKHELFSKLSEHSLTERFRFIRFPVDVDRFDRAIKREDNNFNIGYVGTVNYAKMHRKFLPMCADVNIPDVRFLICGEDKVDSIEQESQKHKPERFHFMGFQREIGPILGNLDIFAYPLNETHFGSGEQVILEAMHFGLPVVAFSNAAESEIIKNNETGILVDTEEEYVSALEYLYQNPDKRHEIGKNAQRFIDTELHPRRSYHDLEKIYREVILGPKKTRTLEYSFSESLVENSDDPNMGSKLFIESLGNQSDEFLACLATNDNDRILDVYQRIANVEISMKTKTKGSINQYLYFFPDDPYLNLWAGIVSQKENRHRDAVVFFEKTTRFGIAPPQLEDLINNSLSQF